MNSFENLYGYLFRNYSKSIIYSLSSSNVTFESDLLTIGILQYHAFDSSFYYTPSLKNALIKHSDIKSIKFPTKNHKLWNIQLMYFAAKYVSQTRAKGWIEQLFQDNATLEKENASIYALTSEKYSEYRDEWLDWYVSNITHFENINIDNLEDENVKILLNQLFYFLNYLTTIARRPAFISEYNKRLSSAESIYLCINNNQLLNNQNSIFNIRNGEIENGIDIPWIAEENPSEFKAELIFF